MISPKELTRPHTDARESSALAALRTSLEEVLTAQAAEVEAMRAAIDDLAGDTDVDSMRARLVAESAALRCMETVAEIRHALRRIDLGAFGACERCGASIALERLQVIPYARRCDNCPGPVPRLIG